MLPKKIVICYVNSDWHLTKSDAFLKSVINPLKKFFTVYVKKFNLARFLEVRDTYIIFLFIPTYMRNYEKIREYILSNENNNTYFLVPMWDWVYTWNMNTWELIPKNMKIISFCEQLYLLLRKYGYENILYVKYFHQPYNPVNFSGGRILSYWNRTNLYSKEFLLRLCEVLYIEKFLYLEKLDPWHEKMFELPNKYNKTKIITYRGWNSRREYHNILRVSNTFLCPRLREGIGLSFIEQLSRGSVCFAMNEPTMNEYIKHKETGYLFNTLHPDSIDWNEIQSLNIEKLSQNTLSFAVSGYNMWNFYESRLVDFIEE